MAKNQYAEQLLMQAKQLVNEAKYDSALTSSQEALTLYTKEEDRRGIIRSAYVYGNIQREFGMLDDAFETLQKHTENAKKWFGDLDIGYAKLLLELGIVIHRQGDLDSALSIFLTTLKIFQLAEPRSNLDIANALNFIGLTYARKGYNEKALEFYLQALELRLSELGKNHLQVALSYNNIGSLYKVIGDYNRALNYHLRALQIRKESLSHNHPEIGISYYNIGNVFEKMGQIESTIMFQEKSLKILEEAFGDRHHLVQMNIEVMGSNYLDINEYELALKYKERALSLQQTYLPPQSIYLETTYRNMGYYYYSVNDLPNSRRYYQLALENALFNWGKKHAKTADDYNLLSGLSLKTKSYDEALHYIHEAIEANTKPSSVFKSTSQIEHYFSIPLLHISLLRKANIHLALSKKYRGNDKITHLKASLNSLRKLITIIKKYRISFRDEKSKIVLAKRAQNAYSTALSVTTQLHSKTLDRQFLEETFAFMEQSKMTTLLDALHESDAREFAQIPKSLLDQEKQIRTDLTYYDQNLKEEESLGAKSDSVAVSALQAKVFELHRSYNSLVDLFEENYPDYYALKFQDYTATIDDVRTHLLDEDEAMIEYFVGADSLYILAITDEDIQLAHASHKKLLGAQIEKFRDAIVNKDSASFMTTGSALFEQLLAPVLDTIEDKPHWVIAPHGELNYIPFEALPKTSPSKDSDPIPYILRNHSFRYIYSSTIEVSTRQKRIKSEPQTWNKDFLAFAPVFESGVSIDNVAGLLLSGKRAKTEPVEFVIDGETLVWPPEEIDSTLANPPTRPEKWGYLPYTRREVEGIQKLFRENYSWGERLWGNKATVLLQDDASEANLKSLNLKEHRFVHFATHGAINESIPELSGIIMAQDTTGGEDGVLHLGEIYNLEMNADLVVLSACETGLGKLAGGEGIIGLARGFKYAGANALLVSLWPVDDASTQNLMTSFYSGILNGKEKAEAIRLAKLNLIDQQPKHADPFYWAGFVLIGE